MQSLLDSIDVPSPPPLDPGPALSRLFLESPWWVVGVLAALAVVAYATLNRRGRFQAGIRTALALLAAAGGIGLLATMVETPRERMRAAGQALVRSVAEADSASLGALLAPDARLVYFASPEGIGREAILDLVDRRFRNDYRVREWSIVDSQATVDGPNVGRVQVKVRVVGVDWNVPHFSWWRIDYRLLDDDRVEVRGIAPIVIAGVRNAL